MANPSRKYLEQLKRYGLGSGGLGFNRMGERTVFAEEGPSSTVDVDVFDKGVANLAKRLGISPEEVKKRQGLGTKIISGSSQTKTMPSDVSSFSELAKAYSDIKDVSKDPSVISQPATIEDILTADPSVFRLEGPEGMPVAPMDSSGAGDEAEAQKIIAEKESLETSKKNQEATAEGKAIFDAKQQMRDAESDSLNKLFEQSMEDYLTNVRGVAPEARTKDLEEYKREFAEATGIDISGKVDKSMALASFGLALMQNRAGKGFNVGRMLSSVGEAGEAAMPALEKAKTRARNDAIAAGKYALETRASDRATDAVNREKSFNRPGYYIFERGKDIEDGNKKFNEGKIVYLNGEEINKLITDKDFDKRFSFIKKSEYLDIKKELTKPVERGEMWVKGDPNNFSLIGGDSKDVPPALQVLAHNKNPNYEGETPSSKLLAEDEDDVKARFVRYQEEVLKNKEKLTELVSLLQEGISIPKQISGKVQQLAKSMGVNVDTSSPAAAQQALKNIAIDNVLEILKESGRTISEGERQRVDKRVGNVAMNLQGSDLDLVLNQVEYVYDMVVNTPQKNLNDALNSFENQFGYSIMDNATEEEKITQDELDLINENRKAQGLEPRTMDNFK